MSSRLLTGQVPVDAAGQRLDQVLTALFPDFSRSRLQSWIKDGTVRVNGQILRGKDRVQGGEEVLLTATFAPRTSDRPEAIPLDLVYEDPHLLIVNKPVGLVVHPGAGHPEGTLVNALLHYAPELGALPRSGLVHRIDRDTSGLLMVARTEVAHKVLVERLQAHAIEREYLAVVQGYVTGGGCVDAPIGRHSADRKRFSVREGGRRAVTHYRLVERLTGHALLRLRLETGRTHQIRVHMAHIRHPLAGDTVYGGRLRLPRGATVEQREALGAFRRQALHATRLGLEHPVTGDFLSWDAPIPDDMQHLIDILQEAPSP